MSLFEKQNLGGKEQFCFDGARMIDGMIHVLQGAPKSQVTVVYDNNSPNDIHDQLNVERLKEELGVIFMENQMKDSFMKNNVTGDDKIKNAFQLRLYNDFQKMNTFLAAQFLYFYHQFSWTASPAEKTDFESSAGGNKFYVDNRKTKQIGLPSKKIIEEIKTVYPYMHNMMVVKLLEVRYGKDINIALMNINEAKEQLKEGELLGQIETIKPKKQAKLTLFKK